MDRSPIYLDSNVVIDTIEGRDNELMGLLFRSLYMGPYCYPFSAETVGEITDLERPDRNEARLMYLEDLSKGVYFENSFNSIKFRSERPKNVFKTINEVGAEIDFNKMFANVIPFEHILELRKAYKLDPSVLNNMVPSDAIQYIDETLASYDYLEKEGAPIPPKSIKDMVQMVSGICDDAFKDVGKGLGEKADHDESRKDIILYFSLLDSFGYWGDPKKKYEKGSRLVDAQHALVGSYFNGVVSRDTHFIRKAKAAYEYIGLDVNTYSTTEYKAHLSEVLSNVS